MTNDTINQHMADQLFEHFGQSPDSTYLKGTIITFANEEPRGVSLLVEGFVEQYDITPDGNKITVNVFKPPAFFPMSWAINKTPNTYFFEAITDVKLKTADADKTVSFLHSNPDILFDLLSRVYKGTDGLLKRLVLAASGTAINRLIFELLIEAYRFGTELEDGARLISVKQSTLAARSGLARETVSRELHKLGENSCVSLTKKGIVIDTQELEKMLNITF